MQIYFLIKYFQVVDTVFARNTHSKQITHPVIYLVDQCVSSVPWTLIEIVFPYLLTNITTAINSMKHLAKAPLTPEFDISSLRRGLSPSRCCYSNSCTNFPQ